MQLSINRQIGKNKYSFTFEGNSLFYVILESQKLAFDDVEKCGCCESDDIYLESHFGKENGKDTYEYCSIRCKKCRASLTFGNRKDDKATYFLRKKEDKSLDWQEYKDDKNKNNTKESSSDGDKERLITLQEKTQLKEKIGMVEFAKLMTETNNKITFEVYEALML